MVIVLCSARKEMNHSVVGVVYKRRLTKSDHCVVALVYRRRLAQSDARRLSKDWMR